MCDFGGWSGFWIDDDCNETYGNTAELFNGGYEYPDNLDPENNEDDGEKLANYLAGTMNFKVLEIEVYQIY